MENKEEKVTMNKRKILSLIGLVIFSLAFIFACLRKVLPLGNWIVCTFGIMTYPLFLILSLIQLAKVLGLSYRRSMKSTVYVLIALTSLLFVIQAISTYKQLDKVATFDSFKNYLKFSYDSKITLVGGFGSIFVGGLSILLGAMGTIVAFVICLTIFIGVIVDYENYGKFEDSKVRKLKTRAMRKKVNESDKNPTKDGMPNYEFSNEESIGTIEVKETEFADYETNVTRNESYEQTDVVGEISTETYGEYTEQYEQTNPFTGYTQSEESLNKSRRDFMGGTFGYQTTPAPLQAETSTVEYEDDSYVETPQTQTPTYLGGYEMPKIERTTDLWGSSTEETNKNDIELDDNLKDLLSKEEDEVDNLNPDSEISNPFEGLDGEIDLNVTLDPKPEEFVQKPLFSNPFDGVFGTKTIAENDIEKRNSGILSNSSSQTKKDKPVISSGSPIGMPGVRYNPPPLNLLAKPIIDNGNYEEEQTRKTKQLEEVLEAFGVPAKVVNIVRGPKITRYELSVPLGTSVKKIPNYEADIQRALAAKTINIQAPIPGSSYVGIELENDTFTSVFERELLESPEFQNAKGSLPIAIGKDISGAIIVKSLEKMVHCLVAGSTGSGKSVFIHNIVLSLVYRYSPEDLRLVMIDPKKVEFGFYNGLPHLVTPEVVLGTDKAVNALKWCVKEMDRRFTIMEKAGCQKIDEYNKSEVVKSGQLEKFPYIVIIVDELAEIMITYKKDAETAIQRITQLARACGMHMVLAVQRPSVDIITGVIKNNVPARFAFRLQSYVDSKTMLGTNGAEKLLGAGDMLMSLTDSSTMPRLQAAYATNDEIRAVVEFIKSHNVSNFNEDADNEINNPPQESGGGDSQDPAGGFVTPPTELGKLDVFFKAAVKSVMLAGSASISYLQRRLGVGYARAAKIVDQMEAKGYIAPATGAKTRKVLISPDQFREDFGEEYNS